MNAEIVCIGTELLLGHIVNTNASFIAARLAEIGIDHYFQTTVGDNHQRLEDTMNKALDRSDIVITTGGLGPTIDDITTEVIAKAVNKKLIFEKAILKDITDYFKRQNKKIPKDSLCQALIPEGARWLKNPFGTAPGLIVNASPHPTLSPMGRGNSYFSSPLPRGERITCPPKPWRRRKVRGISDKIIIALPGPPREMQPMVENYVIPYLKKRVKGHPSTSRFDKLTTPRTVPSNVEGLGTRGSKDRKNPIIKSKSIKLIGLPEANVNNKAKDLLGLGGAVTVGIYARLGEVELKIMAKAQSEKLADIEIKKIEKIIRKRFKDYIYGVNKETLGDAAANLLIKRKKTIAIAESCTGGLISNLITDVPGASKFFMEGVISYSNESKMKDLNVRPGTIKDYGAVSAQVSKEMAVGVRKRAGVDMGIGVTGIAGPTGATKKKPVGLVYISISTRNKILCRQFNFSGSRVEIKHQAAQTALDMLRHVCLP